MISRNILPRTNPPEHFFNRELSLLAFNRRVLAQARNPNVPLLDRLSFLCILSSNLDEFFEIRVAGLKEQLRAGSMSRSVDGLTAAEAFRLVSQQTHGIIREQYSLLNDVVLPALDKEGIRFLRRSAWNEEQQAWIRDYFFREVMPVLTPIGLDPSHPFPRVLNKSLNFAVELEGRDAFGRNTNSAIVQAPRALPRVIHMPEALSGCPYGFVFLSSVVHAHVDELFTGMNVLGCYQFRVTRNSDLFVDEEEIKNLRTALQGELPQRHFGDAVRLEVADNCSPQMANFLLAQFGLSQEDLYPVHGLVNLVRLNKIRDFVDRDDLKYPPFVPGNPRALEKRKDIFSAIRAQDVLIHHPFQSFQPVIDLIEQCARDPQVLAIKMTVYRTGTDSVLMESLIRAAQNGKEVTVVVELMARFDEEANIHWATRLENAGAHVVYGVVGYKTHSKMLMVVRREGDALRRYVHLGTGNYHPRTARLYTDFGLLTANPEIGSDVAEVFQQLTGLGRAAHLNHLWQSPFSLHNNVIRAIRREANHARAGQKAVITAKMNSLTEPEVVEALYEASQAGVSVDLIVRGQCILRPGVEGLSENIRVRSILGRFLEHHRIFHFHDGGDDLVYLSSADWMDRNFFRRIELAFPVLDPRLKRRVINEGLKPYLVDNCLAWLMDSDGVYHLKQPRSNAKPHASQQELLATLGTVE